MAGFSACVAGPAKVLTIIGNIAFGNAADTSVLDVRHQLSGGVFPADTVNCSDTAYLTVSVTDAQAQHLKGFKGTLAFRFRQDAKGSVPVFSMAEMANAAKFICGDEVAATGCRLEVKIPRSQLEEVLKAGGFAVR